MDEENIKNLWDKLLNWYKKENIHKAVVAFSGGKDSRLVLDSAIKAVEDLKVIIIDSEVYPRREIEHAKNCADELGVEYDVVQISILKKEKIRENPPDRCYHCKVMLFKTIKNRIDKDRVILEGTNASEIEGHRPGLKAVKDYARAPLLEVGFGEEEVRDLLRWRKLEVWDRPSFACLASRFPTGMKLTQKKLDRVEKIEDFLFKLGLKQLRVRDFGDNVRIEVWPKDMFKIIDNKGDIIKKVKEEGYDNVFLDLEGYRTGSISPKD